jgi:hypothetical protein
MGASRLKPLTVKEVEKLTATKPSTIKHRSLGGVPGFVMVHICINMIHISPWEATLGLMRGAGRILASGSLLYLYGPYRRSDIPLEPSNGAFDLDLRARDARWGLRELDSVVQCANEHGLGFDRLVEMPANNLSLIFRKS